MGLLQTTMWEQTSRPESFTWNNVAKITVLEATPRRIEKLRIQVLEEAARETA